MEIPQAKSLPNSKRINTEKRTIFGFLKKGISMRFASIARLLVFCLCITFVIGTAVYTYNVRTEAERAEAFKENPLFTRV